MGNLHVTPVVLEALLEAYYVREATRKVAPAFLDACAKLVKYGFIYEVPGTETTLVTRSGSYEVHEYVTTEAGTAWVQQLLALEPFH